MDTAHAPAPDPVPTRPAPGHVDVWLVRPPLPGRPPADHHTPWPSGPSHTPRPSGPSHATRPPGLSTASQPPGLSAAELRRAASFARPADRAAYATAHTALRQLLGGYLDRPPGALTFVREPCPGCAGPHGRPAVIQAGGGPPLHFSLAHSRGLIAVAVAPRVIGVDVERLPSPETVEACARALHPGEQAELAAAPPGERRAHFGRLWTRKEAYLKALGTGLSRHPRTDYLGSDLSRRPARWAVLDLPAGPEHAAAIAVPGDRPDHITVRWLPAGLPYGEDVPYGEDAPGANPGGTVTPSSGSGGAITPSPRSGSTITRSSR
ncbi:4'-phosphopantetheinyl transferase family protein [Streptomyces microflavus]|uniref:4'-phosphopantetheinyl transferase family protein n=1 Tax=Streptomyces microflavus TaxID=1919 RepID=UPI0033A9939F